MIMVLSLSQQFCPFRQGKELSAFGTMGLPAVYFVSGKLAPKKNGT
jgi:hypothetical protein